MMGDLSYVSHSWLSLFLECTPAFLKHFKQAILLKLHCYVIMMMLLRATDPIALDCHDLGYGKGILGLVYLSYKSQSSNVKRSVAPRVHSCAAKSYQAAGVL